MLTTRQYLVVWRRWGCSSERPALPPSFPPAFKDCLHDPALEPFFCPRFESSRFSENLDGRGGAAAATIGGLSLARGAHAAGSDVIRIGLIGCGGRGPGAAVNAMNVDPGLRLVAMTDIFADKVQSRRAMLKQQKPDQVQVDDDHCFSGLDGYRHVIESADAVLIACAAKYHCYYLHAAVKAGKHVFVEKPHAIDPVGVRQIAAACTLAKQKKLCVMSGLQSRYQPGYRETIKRIHDGAIGDIVSMQETWLRGPYGLNKRNPKLTEVEFQFSNQYHFSWLSGDDVPQTLTHNLDRALWAMKGKTPVRAQGMGGRSASFGEVYGNVFDHHSVVYEYANGTRLYALCRTQNGCYEDNSSVYLGTKGQCNLTRCRSPARSRGTIKARAMQAPTTSSTRPCSRRSARASPSMPASTWSPARW